MRTIILAASLAVCAQQALAINKCTDPKTGKVSYSDAPCPTEARHAAVKVYAAPPSAAVAPVEGAAPVMPPAGTVEQRMLAKIEHDKKVDDLKRSIASTENAIYQRNVRMNDELAALRAQKSRARNNLAGATWEQSLSTEMQAVTMKYQINNEADQEQVKQMRAELQALEQRGPAVARR